MNRIAKVWEELDKKRGRHANLSKASKRKNVKLATVQDFDRFDTEDTQLNNDLVAVGRGFQQEIRSEIDTILSDAEVLINLNDEFRNEVDSAFDELKDQFDELGMDIESQPIAKMHMEFMANADENDRLVKEFAYEALDYFEGQIRAIIGSR